MATPMTDAELVSRSRGADDDAFAALVRRHQDRLVGYLTRLTGGDRARAEELAQESFVRVYRALDDYREEGAFAAYLFRIATNLVRSEERRRHRWARLWPRLAGPEREPPEHGPQARTLAGEARRQVQAALDALELDLRAPLVLREIEGLSYGDVAAALGLAEGTVKSRIHRGRKRLKTLLAPYWHGDDGGPP